MLLLEILVQNSTFKTKVMRKIIITSIAFVLFVTNALAQQESLFTQYMSNLQNINPAYVGTNKSAQISLLARNQWVGMEGAPETQTFIADVPLHNLNMGLGLSIERDKIALLDNYSISGNYAYHLQLGEDLTLSLGVKAGIASYSANFNKLNLIDNTDASFANANEKELKFDFGAGAYLKSEKFYLGVSVPHISTDANMIEKSDLDYKKELHYYMISGALFNVNENIVFNPSVMVRATSEDLTSVDATAMFIMNDKYWLGVSVRGNEAVAGIAQMQLTKEIKIGYSYDYSISAVNNYTGGSHEFHVAYRINNKKAVLKSPRYF